MTTKSLFKGIRAVKVMGFVALLFTIALLGFGVSHATVTVTDSVTVSGTNATFDINISGCTNITDIYLFYDTNVSDIDGEVANWTDLWNSTGDGNLTTWENTTVGLTSLDAGTYYYSFCFCDNGTWDNATIGSFVVAEATATTTGGTIFTSTQASEVALILTYGILFGVAMFFTLYMLARNRRTTKVSLRNGAWWGISIVVALIVVIFVYWLCNIYMATDYMSNFASWLANLLG